MKKAPIIISLLMIASADLYASTCEEIVDKCDRIRQTPSYNVDSVCDEEVKVECIQAGTLVYRIGHFLGIW